MTKAEPPTFRVRLAIILALAILAALGGTWYYKYRQLPQSARATPAPTTEQSMMSLGRLPAGLKAPNGYEIHVFADHLGVARGLVFSPGGTLLVSDPKAGTITALPDVNRDGVVDSAKVVLRASGNPHGMAFYQNRLYVASTQNVTRYDWNEQELVATNGHQLLKLPPNSDHDKRTIAFDGKGQMYVSVGSTCDACTESDARSATIVTADADGKNPRIFAAGLRNAPFMAINPTTKELWATEMGRDNLGDTTPPDEINIIRSGQNYGWPFCYGNRIHDTKFDPTPSPGQYGAQAAADPCAATVPPTYEIPAHSAPLGLAFIDSPQFSDLKGDLLVAYHGSWNRTTPDGYKVVRLSVRGNAITASQDFITGFINGRTITGRPAALAFDRYGSLYLSDDKAGAVYIIQKQP